MAINLVEFLLEGLLSNESKGRKKPETMLVLTKKRAEFDPIIYIY